MAITVSLFKELSAPTIMYDKYYDGKGQEVPRLLWAVPEGQAQRSSPFGPQIYGGLCPAHPVLHTSSYCPLFHLQLLPESLVISCHQHKCSQGPRLYQGV